MAIAWKDVIASQQYQALPPEEKALAQAQYFDEVVAPQAGDNQQAARDQFYAAYPIAENQPQAPGSNSSLASGMMGANAELSRSRQEGVEGATDLRNQVIDAFTGESRMTPQMQSLQNVGSAPELNEFSGNALRAGVAQMFGSDASQEQILQSMGATLSEDEKGNVIVSLPSGNYALNKPGLSPQDVTSLFGNLAAFTPAARSATVLGAAAKSALTDTALQGSVQAAGGEEIDPARVALSAGIGAAGKSVENALSVGARATLGNASPADRAAVEFARENRLPLMTTDLVNPRTNVGRQARTVAERIPYAGTGGQRATQQEARQSLIQTFSDEVGGISDEALYRSATQGQRAFIDAAGKRYDRIINAMGSSPVDITKTLQAIDNQIARITRPGASQDRSALNVLQQFKKDISSGTNTLDIARSNRTDLRKRFMASADSVDRDVLEKASDAIYKAYTMDMRKAVADNLGDKVAMDMYRADRSWAKFNDMMGNTRVQKALQSGRVNPEEMSKLILSQKSADRSQLYRLLDGAGRQRARASLVQNALDKATDASGNVSVERFINAMHRTRKNSDTFFRGEHGKRLDGVMKYLDSTRQAATAAASPLTGQLANPVAILAGGASIANPAIAKSVAAAAGFGLAGRAYESPVVRNAMIRLANTPKGSTAYDRAISNVTQALTAASQSVDQ